MTRLCTYARLGLGLLLIVVFLYGLHLISQQNEAVGQLRMRTETKDIDNSGLFYTESEEGRRAVYALRKGR